MPSDSQLFESELLSPFPVTTLRQVSPSLACIIALYTYIYIKFTFYLFLAVLGHCYRMDLFSSCSN